MAIKIHNDVEQGSPEWHQLRLGVITASIMGQLITPTGKVANNDKSRAIIYDLAAQRITGRVPPHFESFDMARGKDEEEYAMQHYATHYSADVRKVGFITNDKWGFTLGFSPDWLIGQNSFGEAKSKCPKKQVEIIASNEMPEEYIAQVQTGLLVTEYTQCEFCAYSNGMEMFWKKILPDAERQAAILEAAAIAEKKIQEVIDAYKRNAATLFKAEYREPPIFI